MLHELEVLEARHIADLAAAARAVRDRLLEQVPDADLGEPMPARGAHNPGADVVLDGVLASTPAFVALRAAITALPRDIRAKLWVVAQIGHGDVAVRDWTGALDAASALRDDEIVEDLVGQADLHACLRKGLYELGVALPPGEAG